MQKIPNYAQLWQEIYQARHKKHPASPPQPDDHWHQKAQEFFQKVEQRWQTPDSSRTILRQTAQAIPHCTLIDIGSGPGNFSLFIAPHCKHVTAIDPSPSMLAVLQQQLTKRNLTNITPLQTTWAAAQLPPKSAHITFASHSIYGDPDIIAFIQKMNRITTHRCFLLVRAPFPNAIMGQVAQHLWGHPHDSPNFHLAYNTLLQLGIIANVTIETPNGWKPVYSDSIPAALEKVKHHFNIAHQTTHDQAITHILQNHLLPTPTGHYQWPQWGESALISWQPTTLPTPHSSSSHV